MSLVLATLLAAAPATVPVCSWDRPGVNPFMGDVVAAVDRYADIPADVRKRLKARMAKRDYDEIAVITRDSISGRAKYEAEIREMHFGAGQICKTVTRSRWTADWKERGLVYCEDKHCIIVPTVCRNVSRITRQDPKVASANGRREEPVTAARPAQDEGLLANAPLLSTLTPQGHPMHSVAPAQGPSGWPAWGAGGDSSGGHWGGGSGGGSAGDPGNQPGSWGGFGTPSWAATPSPGSLPSVVPGLIPDRLVQGDNTQPGETHGGGAGHGPSPGGSNAPGTPNGGGAEQPTAPSGNGTPGNGAPGTPGEGGHGGTGGTGGPGAGVEPDPGIDELPIDPIVPTVIIDLNPPLDPTDGEGGPTGGNPNTVPLSGTLSPTAGTVPEPSSALLALLAVAAMGAARRARRA